MKIEVGKTYLTRNGKQVTITDYTVKYPFKSRGGDEYSAEGTFFYDGNPSVDDLIAEVSHTDQDELLIIVPHGVRYKVEVAKPQYGDPDDWNKIKREGGFECSGLAKDLGMA